MPGAPVSLPTEAPVTSIDLARAHARRSLGNCDDSIAPITERDVVTPVVLRGVGTRFEVIDGARRLYAAHKAGRTSVPVIIRETTDSDALLDGLLANLHREDRTPSIRLTPTSTWSTCSA